jgi:hypothetical protein
MNKREKQKLLDCMIKAALPLTVAIYTVPRHQWDFHIQERIINPKLPLNELITEETIRNSPAFKRYVKQLPKMMVGWAKEKFVAQEKIAKKNLDKNLFADGLNEKMTKKEVEQFKTLFGQYMNVNW